MKTIDAAKGGLIIRGPDAAAVSAKRSKSWSSSA